MNLKESATLLGISRERAIKLITAGIRLQDGNNTKILAQHRGGNDYEIDETDLDAFLEILESQEPGRWPPVNVRRELLIETGYKCAICRSDAPLQFQHIIEWAEIKHHDVRHMLAICGVCHDKITRLGMPDTTAQYQIKNKYTNMDVDEKEDTKIREIPITDPLMSCDHEIVDRKEIPRIVWLLPRGFIILEDIEWQKSDGWSVTAHYYHYGEGWRYGTHYHESYGKEWQNDIQCRKLTIPIGDWKYCGRPLELMRSLREHRQNDIEAFANENSKNGDPIVYFAPGEPIIPAKLPREKGVEGVYPINHDVRDLSGEFERYKYVDFNKYKDLLQEAHNDAVCLRIRSIGLLSQILGDSHPCIRLFKETLSEYHKEMNGEELSDWTRRIRRLFLEAYELST